MSSHIFNQEELETIRSKARYWHEVAQRDSCGGGGGMSPGQILQAEFAELYREHGLKLLWVVRAYADTALKG